VTTDNDVRYEFFVAAWYRLLFFVGHAFNEINDVRQQISRRQVVRTGRNQALLYIIFKTGELSLKGSPWDAKIHKWIK